MERRDFLKNLTIAAAAMGFTGSGAVSAASAGTDKHGDVLPKRPFGKTGEQVTMLGIGGFHVGWTTDKDAQEVIEAAMAEGIRFFDTAEGYANGLSEERYGKYLIPKYRDEIFLMTKTNSQTAEQTRQHLEGSLQRLQCDVIDLWQLHTLQSPEDVDQRVANGVLDVMREAKASGKVRHIGFTGHASPAAHLRMLEHTKDDDLFETCQMPINLVDAGTQHSFTVDVLPKLVERNFGVIAMKTLADGQFFHMRTKLGQVHKQSETPVVPEIASIAEALYWAWSLPVGVLVTGAENATLVHEKAGLCREFAMMDDARREELIDKAAEIADSWNFEYYKRQEEK